MHLGSQVLSHNSITLQNLVMISRPTTVGGAAGQPSIDPLSILTNLTSGIEIEVMAYGPRRIDPDFHVADALCKPVLLQCSTCSRSHPWKLPYLGLVDTANFAPESSYTFWNTTYDDSAQPDKNELRFVPEGSEFYSLEIVSRVMNFNKPTPCPLGQRYPCTGELFEWDAHTEIFSVKQRIKEAFSGPGFCLANNSHSMAIQTAVFTDLLLYTSTTKMWRGTAGLAP